VPKKDFHFFPLTLTFYLYTPKVIHQLLVSCVIISLNHSFLPAIV